MLHDVVLSNRILEGKLEEGRSFGNGQLAIGVGLHVEYGNTPTPKEHCVAQCMEQNMKSLRTASMIISRTVPRVACVFAQGKLTQS